MENNVNFKCDLLKNVHQDIKPPTENGESYFVYGDYLYFHYKCDGVNDVGWGCGYRTLQTMCSQIKSRMQLDTVLIPTIQDIQRILTEIGDKDEDFLNSCEWIGSVEIFYIVNYLFDTPCKILHIGQNKSLIDYADELKSYFIQYGGIIMMGGEMDNSSKGICGLHIGKDDGDIYFLIIDPHFNGSATSVPELQEMGYAKWQHVKNFNDSNYFYNLCMPLIK